MHRWVGQTTESHDLRRLALGFSLRASSTKQYESMNAKYDAVVVGAGPNGLTAAITIAEQGHAVLVLEAHPEIGGGTRTAELTLPGFWHDVCSAVHPMALASPAFARFDLQKLGVSWVEPPTALAHPLDRGPAAVLMRSLDDTAAQFGQDASAYRRMLEPLVRSASQLFQELLRPIRTPKHPWLLARFGLLAMSSAQSLSHHQFSTEPCRALFAGCAAHSFLPLNAPFSSAIGLALMIAAHAKGWPIARGGSMTIARALAARFVKLGGAIETGHRVERFTDLPQARAVLFDTSPQTLLRVCHDRLPSRYRNQLAQYRLAPGSFKLDWALSDPIPWSNPECRTAGTVHVGGPFAEIQRAEYQVNHGEHPARPFVLVVQPSRFDASRAPPGKHTGWAYCHVPHGSTADMTDAIEQQIERFAPGFRGCILARHRMNTRELFAYNENYVGGDIAGGANDFLQLLWRPNFALTPYATPNPNIFLCSSATPPGGGVHGMCGYHAARVVLRQVFGDTVRVP